MHLNHAAMQQDCIASCCASAALYFARMFTSTPFGVPLGGRLMLFLRLHAQMNLAGFRPPEHV